jgi:hypothetical protein
MRSYALAPETIRGYLRRTLLRFHIVVVLCFLAFGVFLVSRPDTIQWTLVLTIVAVTAVAYFTVIFDFYRRQLRAMVSIRIEITNSSIVFRQKDREPIVIHRADVIEVQARKDGLLVLTSYKNIWLLIPYGLSGEGDADVLRELSTWIGLEILPALRNSLISRVFWLCVLSGLLIVIFANSLVTAVIMGALLLLFGIYFEQWMKSYEVELRVIRTYNMGFAFLVFVIVMKSCLLAAFQFVP